MIGWFLAHARDEVDGATFEAYRRGGVVVARIVDALEQARLASFVNGCDAWSRPASLQRALTCGWNAAALQLAADAMVETDYKFDELTIGTVDAGTGHEALAFYGQVGGWATRAQQALDSDGFRLDVDVPAAIPPWANRRVTPVHRASLLAAMTGLRRAAEILGTECKFATGDDDKKRAAQGIAEVAAEAMTAADYATAMNGADLSTDAAAEVVVNARVAFERYYLLGQLQSWPELALRPRPGLQTTRRILKSDAGPRIPRPGEKGFDPWCLTDARTVRQWRKMPDATRAIKKMWAADPDPDKTLTLKEAIDAALYRNDIAYEVGHYFRCPWSSIYLVKRPVTLAGHRLQPLQQFSYEVGRNPQLRGNQRDRRLVMGPFAPTDIVHF
jgi:hypothetical protein